MSVRCCAASVGSSGNYRASLIFEADDARGRSKPAYGLWCSLFWDVTCVSPSYLSVSISSIVAWILAEVPNGENVGFDPFLFSVGMFSDSSLDLCELPRRVAQPPGRHTCLLRERRSLKLPL